MREVRAALGAAIVAGLAVALAPAIPGAIRSAVLVASLALWTGAVGWAVVAGVRTLRQRRISPFMAMGLAGIALAVLATTQLELMRMLADRPALTWNVDWRYALNHAQAIARSGGLEQSLDYSGAPIEYHVGPAWFAGAVARLFGGGMSQVLFGLVPLLCTLTFAAAAVHLLRSRGIGGSLALSATGLVMALPGLAFNLPLTAYCFVLSSCRSSPVMWTFSHEMMLNSYLGLAVGMAALALLLDRDARLGRTALACAGLAALVMLKPQTFVGFGVLAGLVGLGYLFGLNGFTPRGPRVLLAAVAAGVLATGLLFTLPHVTDRFATPQFAPGRTEFAFEEDRLLATALLVIALLAARRFLREHAASRALMLAAALALFSLAALWSVVSFPIRADIVERMVALGADPEQRANFAQSLQPLRLLVALLALAALVGSIPLLNSRRARIAQGAGWATSLSPLLFIGFALASPLEAYEADEDADLLAVLEQLPDDAGLLIASDLADGAEDYRRPLRGFTLTAYTGRPFYVANLQYGHHAQPDAAERMQGLRRFFGSRWSPWHSRWLADNGIGAVLVDTRCVPPWIDEPARPLRQVARQGRWTGFVVEPGGEPTPAAPPTWRDVTPAYGQSECLTGGLRTPAPGPRSASREGEATATESRSEL